VGRDDENLSGSLTFVTPAVRAARWNARSIATFKIVNLIFKRQLDGPLEDDCQLFSPPHIGFMPALSPRLNGDHHGLQLAVLIEWAQRFDFRAGPFALDHRSSVGADDCRQWRVYGAKKFPKRDSERRGNPFRGGDGRGSLTEFDLRNETGGEAALVGERSHREMACFSQMANDITDVHFSFLWGRFDRPDGFLRHNVSPLMVWDQQLETIVRPCAVLTCVACFLGESQAAAPCTRRSSPVPI
jgi:hypothetical protein